MSLQPSALYIALYVRTDPPLPNNFHWALYLHHSPSAGGTKYHITNEGGRSAWIPSHGPESNILKTFLLVGLVRIAEIPASDAVQHAVDQAIRTYDAQLNDLGGTCRTWLFQILRLLQCRGEGDSRPEEILESSLDLAVLEKEVMEWGNLYAEEACLNVQPRPVGEVSCILSQLSTA